MGKEVVNLWCWTTGYPHAKEWCWTPSLSHIQKLIQKWTRDLNVKAKTKILARKRKGKST